MVKKKAKLKTPSQPDTYRRIYTHSVFFCFVIADLCALFKQDNFVL